MRHAIRALTSILAILLASPALAADYQYQGLWAKPGLSLQSSTPQGVELNYSLDRLGLEDVTINREAMQAAAISAMALPNQAGAPDVPSISRWVAVPQGARARVEVVSKETEVIGGVELAPAPVIPSEKEDGLTYFKDQAIYSSNAAYPEWIAKASEPTQMRGVDAVLVAISPLQYNPVTKELFVHRNIRVRVSFEGGNGRFGEDRLRSRWWDPILAGNLINFNQLPKVDYDARAGSRDGYEYVIICPDNASSLSWADTIKQWRQLQGISTAIYNTTQTGATAQQIESWINNAYNNWGTPPVAILLLGDCPGQGYSVDTLTKVYSGYEPYEVIPSDNSYADVDGNLLPDINVSRIEAGSSAALSLMVPKVINYERTPYTDAGYYDHPLVACGWQTERWFQLCTEVVRGFFDNALGKHSRHVYKIYTGTPSVGGAWSTATNTSTVVSYFGPSGTGYIPSTNPYSSAYWNNGTAAAINDTINAGSFLVQHRDHGSEYGWGEPAYSQANARQLTNVRHTFVFTINCLTAAYQQTGSSYDSVCLGEAFYRQPYGAIGYIGPTNVSYSFVNDAFCWGMYDCMWPQFDPGNGNSYLFGGLNLRPGFAHVYGKYYLQASSWPYNPSEKNITYDLFHMHGDAFTMLYSEVPQDLTVNHPSYLDSGDPSFPVTANSGSLICLTVRGSIIGTGTGTGSSLPIAIPVLAQGDTVVVTATKPNYRRYQGYAVVNTDAPVPPTPQRLFHCARVPDLRPTLTFTSTDPQGDAIQYRVLWDTLPGFPAPDSSTTTAFASGALASFTFPQNLLSGRVYWWKVKGTDPSGSGKWGAYGQARCFAVETGMPSSSCSWYQARAAQFAEDARTGLVIEGDTVGLATTSVTDTLLYRDFEGSSLPAGWSAVQNQTPTDTYSWTVGTCSDLSTYIPPSAGAGYAYYNDDDAGSSNPATIEDLLASPVNLPGGMSNLSMAYGYGYRDYSSASESLYVQVRFATGGAWGAWTTKKIYKGSSSSGTEVLNLNAHLPADSMQARWRYDDGNGGWGYAGAVDNVLVSSTHDALLGSGSLTGLPVAYADLAATYSRANWGYLHCRKKAASDSVRVQVQYMDGGAWALIPDNRLSGNSAGFHSSQQYVTVNLTGLNTGTYDTIRVVAALLKGSSKASDDPGLLSVETGATNATPLAVHLSSFSAEALQGRVKISWRTESETECYRWEIGRSPQPDGQYVIIGSLEGHGTSIEPHDYEFTDAASGAGTFYYRLAEIGLSGATTYYGPMAVCLSPLDILSYRLGRPFPNPGPGRFSVSYSLAQPGHTVLSVYNILGQEVKRLVDGQQEPGRYLSDWDGLDTRGRQAANGVYFVKLASGDFRSMARALLLR